jgi:hypothetical protein
MDMQQIVEILSQMKANQAEADRKGDKEEMKANQAKAEADRKADQERMEAETKAHMQEMMEKKIGSLAFKLDAIQERMGAIVHSIQYERDEKI